jgi:hypothetical protein
MLLATVPLAALGAPAAASAETRDPEARVIVAVLPQGTTIEEIGATEGISPGVLSAGMGQIRSTQTYFDISQGNRVNEALYDEPLPLIVTRAGRVPRGIWEEVTERAADAPASLIPGLLASTLRDAGVAVRVAREQDGLAELIAVDRRGRITEVPSETCGARGCGPGLSVIRVEPFEIPALVGALGSRDLLVALAAAPSPDRRLLPIGIAGAGFDGNLTSNSTRTDGLVITSDIAPTALEQLGVETPDEMNGTRIRATGEPDAASVADFQQRLVDRPNRELVVLVPLLAWLAIAGAVAMARGERAARVALPAVGLACAWGPTLLLVAAALDAATLASTLIVGLGALALAAATAALVPGYRGLALACGVAVAAHAADVVAGSPLIAFSVLGPNPSGGVRFFGIGNEHAATLTPLALIGTGAWLATRDVSPRSAAWWFVAVALLAAIAYTPGRFGASVGTAIMLAAGGATAAALALGMPIRRVALAIVGAIAVGLAILSAVDLATGNAHLTRTILGAGETSELLDAFERRIRLMVNTFTSPVYPQLFGATVVLLIVGLVHRASILAWFGDRQPARAGFLGALVAVMVGSVANDSGSVLLVIGTIYLAACAGFFWGTREGGPMVVDQIRQPIADPSDAGAGSRTGRM